MGFGSEAVFGSNYVVNGEEVLLSDNKPNNTIRSVFEDGKDLEKFFSYEGLK